MDHSNITTSGTSTPPPAASQPTPGSRLVLPTVAAYEALLPEIEAVADDELTPVNIDMMAAITTVTGALPEIRGMRPAIAAGLPGFNLEQFDKLEQYTLALTHAHTRYRKTFAPKEDLAELADELDEIRDHMMTNAASLAKMRLISGEQLRSLKTIPGYKALASDVLTLCSTFSDDWDKLEGKTPFTQEELHRVGTRALELVSAVGQREQGPITTGEAVLLRQKAFTLFLRAYDQARRAVQYLRNDFGDADDIAPSLYLNRTRRRGEEAEAGALPVAPAAAPGTNTPAPAPALVIDNPAGFPIPAAPLSN